MMPSWPQLLILILVVVLLFGTRKLRSLGSDLGASIKGFKKAINDDKPNESLTHNQADQAADTQSTVSDSVEENNKKG